MNTIILVMYRKVRNLMVTIQRIQIADLVALDWPASVEANGRNICWRALARSANRLAALEHVPPIKTCK